jgi:hypothetical protein
MIKLGGLCDAYFDETNDTLAEQRKKEIFYGRENCGI